MNSSTIVPIIISSFTLLLGIIGYLVQRTIFKEIDMLKHQKVDTNVCMAKTTNFEKHLDMTYEILKQLDEKLDKLVVEVARFNGTTKGRKDITN